MEDQKLNEFSKEALFSNRTENASQNRDFLLYYPIKQLLIFFFLSIGAGIVLAYWDFETVKGVLHTGSLDAMGNETLSHTAIVAISLLTIGAAVMVDLFLQREGKLWKFAAAVPIALLIASIYAPVSQIHAGDIAQLLDQSGFNAQSAVQSGDVSVGSGWFEKIVSVVLTLLYCIRYLVPTILFAIAFAFVLKYLELIKLNRAANAYLDMDREADEVRTEVEHKNRLHDDLASTSADINRNVVSKVLSEYMDEVVPRIHDIKSKLASTIAMSAQERKALIDELKRAEDVLTVAKSIKI